MHLWTLVVYWWTIGVEEPNQVLIENCETEALANRAKELIQDWIARNKDRMGLDESKEVQYVIAEENITVDDHEFTDDLFEMLFIGAQE